MTDYISGKRMEKLSLDRWENEGGKPSPNQTDMPEEFSSSKRIMEKNGSQIIRGGNRNTF